MKIDRKTVDDMLSLNDAKFGQLIKIIASSSGVSLGDGMPDEKTISGLRALFKEIGDGDLERATKLLGAYKSGKSQGDING